MGWERVVLPVLHFEGSQFSSRITNQLPLVYTKAMVTALLGKGGFLPSGQIKYGVKPDGIRKPIPAVDYGQRNQKPKTQYRLQMTEARHDEK